MSDFHEVLFPVDISYGSSGGPKWKTAVFSADSGFEARVSDWMSTRAEYDVSHGIKTAGQIGALQAFFMNRRGRAYGFRFKDFNDHEALNVHLGVGDYATRHFQIVKTYQSDGEGGAQFSFHRPLKKIEWGSESGVTINGQTITRSTGADRYYAIDYNSGLITLNEPMRGGLYSGTTPSTLVDMITTAEGGTSSAWRSPTLNGGALPYDPNTGWAFLYGDFGTGGAGNGLRKIEIDTAKETAQARETTIGGPFTDYSGIICVDKNGFVYVNAGGASNGQPIVKIDGANLTYMASWGAVTNGISVPTTSSYPAAPGCASLDGNTFAHVGLFGDVVLHQTSDCARLRQLFKAYSWPSKIPGVAPYGETGFAVPYQTGADDFGLGLSICYPNITYEVMTWGARTAEVRAAFYDQKTGGVVLFWEGEEGIAGMDPTDAWIGLWHEDRGGFVWRRRAPELQQNFGLGAVSMAVPVNGEIFWTHTARYFGTRLWRLDTETGVIESRPSAYTGSMQAYDPARKALMVTGDVTGGGVRIASTDLLGVPMTPPEAMNLGQVQFHVGVRFDTDHLNLKSDFWTYGSWDSIPLVEVRNWDDVEID